MNPIRSFEAIIPPESKILILGTMPGVASLEQQEYYAHPRNAFWPIIAHLAGHPEAPTEYAQKIALLKSSGIALWDVCGACLREGSLDSNITDEVPNPIDSLLVENPSIRLLAFNGQPAFKLFKRHFPALIDRSEHIVLPSTSPANARLRFAEKLEKWSELKRWL